MIHSIQISRFGGSEVLKEVELPSPPLTPHSVRIQVDAAGVNFADIMMRMGLYPEAPKLPFVPGYEIAGTIIELGSESGIQRGDKVSSLQVGDRVLAGTRFGGYTTEIVLPKDQVRKIPEKLSFIEAAAIPVNFLTAWVALQEMARIKKGDRVVIHSAAGGVGVAAVQIAAQAGAHVTGLVSSQEKAAPLKSLGANEVLTYSEWETLSLREAAQEAQSFQIILDPSGGKSLKRSFQRLSSGGRVINYGASSVVSGKSRSLTHVANLLLNTFWVTPFKLMMENKGIFGLNLLKYFEHPAKLKTLNDSLDLILARFEDGTFKSVIGKTFTLAEAGKAHDYLQSRKNIGKVVLTPSKNLID